MEKKNKGLIITIVVLVVILLGVSGYLVYDKILKKNDNITEINNKNGNKNNNNSNTMSQEEIETLGKQLFKKTSVSSGMNYIDGHYFYGVNNKSYNSLSSSQKILAVYENLDLSNVKINDDFEFDNMDKPSFTIEKSKIDDMYHELFGLDKKIEYVEFGGFVNNKTIEAGLIDCKWNSNMYKCFLTNGGDANSARIYLSYNKTELVNDNIVVYTKMLYDEIDEQKSTMNKTIRNVLKGLNGKSIGNYDYSENLTEDQIWNRFGNDAQVYKLTFKKDTNDNYYWVSTELMNTANAQ